MSDKPIQHVTVPWHRNPKVRSFVFQAAVIIFLVWLINGIVQNTVANMEKAGILVGLGFMTEVAPFNIGFTPFWDYNLGTSKYWEVLVIGIQNTIFVSFFAIITATFVGFAVGVMRLSPNWLVAKLASGYVEFFRNIPLPLWIFFWYFAVFLPILPSPRESYEFFESTLIINKEGLYLPKPVVDNAVLAGIFITFIISIFVGLFFLSNWAKKRQDATGKIFPIFFVSLAAIIILPVIAFYALGSPYHLDYPVAGKFTTEGGSNLNTSFFVMWFALTVYTAAYIGENVRGGISAVSYGQTEASNSLGIARLVTLRKIIIPQAMRVIIPPTISQYLNLTKNSSLAVIVAYDDIVNIFAGVALNQTGQALPIIAITIGLYGTLSLLTSAILNWYNKRVQLTER